MKLHEKKQNKMKEKKLAQQANVDKKSVERAKKFVPPKSRNIAMENNTGTKSDIDISKIKNIAKKIKVKLLIIIIFLEGCIGTTNYIFLKNQTSIKIQLILKF